MASSDRGAAGSSLSLKLPNTGESWLRKSTTISSSPISRPSPACKHVGGLPAYSPPFPSKTYNHNYKAVQGPRERLDTSGNTERNQCSGTAARSRKLTRPDFITARGRSWNSIYRVKWKHAGHRQHTRAGTQEQDFTPSPALRTPG